MMLAPSRAERVIMRKTIVPIIIAVSAALLGGCAGSLPSGSPLPMTQIGPADSVGGGLPGRREHLKSIRESLPLAGRARHRVHSSDSVGGGLPGKRRER